MSSNKVIRTICYFTDSPSTENVAKVRAISELLESKGYLIQTKRLCTTPANSTNLQDVASGSVDYTSIGAISYEEALSELPMFLATDNLAFNIELADQEIERKHADLLFRIINGGPAKTFDFTYTFNNAASSPYFPSATYQKNGFSIGMQPTNLAKDCATLNEWLSAMQNCWNEITDLFAGDNEFLGVDSSIAPIGGGDGSFVHFVKKLGHTFEGSVTTDLYTSITRYVKENNPKPVGLCGMMLPCLEDDELAAEYDLGNFSIERNMFLSLHSGLGIDTYPIGIDEKPERIVEILKLMQALSNKYKKPLSARFVSDGKAAIGGKTDFQNQYLADCTVRAL
jgi:hypothetical protein